jgi:8-oxo-dGTP diphosphatase
MDTHATRVCSSCGRPLETYRNPTPTVDVIIACPGGGVVLIERGDTPLGWALPGGFVDYGETVENAAIREALEETGLDVELTGLLGVYSDPARDARKHTMSVVYTAVAHDLSRLGAGSDAKNAAVYPLTGLPGPLVFDHKTILEDYARAFARFNISRGRPE